VAVELLLAEADDRTHGIRHQHVRAKRIELGKGQHQDFITDSRLEDCEIRVLCGAAHVNVFTSELVRCTFWPRRRMNGLRLTSGSFVDCRFKGRYFGCRFGTELDEQPCTMVGCDFAAATLHLTDFLGGVDVNSLALPGWPHITVKDLDNTRGQWLALDLPAEMAIINR